VVVGDLPAWTPGEKKKEKKVKKWSVTSNAGISWQGGREKGGKNRRSLSIPRHSRREEKKEGLFLSVSP